MTDMEKVIKGLEELRDHLFHEYNVCYHGDEEDVYRRFLVVEDSLALIREQQEQLKAREWISVRDRLPTYAELKDNFVLVLLDDGLICSTGFEECIEGESIFGEWRQNFDSVTLGVTDFDWMPLEGVTHWMPMPELPKEDDDDHSGMA